MRFWGARYSRTWFTTLAALPLLVASCSTPPDTRAWIVLAPLTIVVVAVIWLVPQAVVGDRGVRLVLRGQLVRWSEIETVLDPGSGDQDLRVEMADGRVLRLDGVPPRASEEVRALHMAHR